MPKLENATIRKEKIKKTFIRKNLSKDIKYLSAKKLKDFR